MTALTWLHLSDLHAWTPRFAWDADRVLETLVADLEGLQRDHELRPDLIFFTGDAAFGQIGPKPREPEQTIAGQLTWFARFLDRVRAAFEPEVELVNVFLVPGNHDVNRDLASPDQSQWLDRQKGLDPVVAMIDQGKPQWRRYMERLGDYRTFLEHRGLHHLRDDPERYAGYKGDARLSGRFLELHVRDLTEEAARRFIAAWYGAVEAQGELGRDPEVAAGLAREAAGDLAEKIFNPEDLRTTSLRDLAKNPLMLQILCLGHRDRKTLPEKRVELYRECVLVLLELWRRAKGMPLDFLAQEALRVLQPLAYVEVHDVAETALQLEEAENRPVGAAAGEAGVGVGDERAVEVRRQGVVDRPIHHPVADPGDRDQARLGVADLQEPVASVAVGAGSQGVGATKTKTFKRHPTFWYCQHDLSPVGRHRVAWGGAPGWSDPRFPQARRAT